AEGHSRENAFSRLPFASLCSVHLGTPSHCPSFATRLRSDHEIFHAACFAAAPPRSFDHLVGAGEHRRCSRPSAFAVLRLITNSYLVGACTGRSAGFSLNRIKWASLFVNSRKHLLMSSPPSVH